MARARSAQHICIIRHSGPMTGHIHAIVQPVHEHKIAERYEPDVTVCQHWSILNLPKIQRLESMGILCSVHIVIGWCIRLEYGLCSVARIIIRLCECVLSVDCVD